MALGSVGKRKAERRDCHVKAQIRFDDGRTPIDCVILNFSATGARATLLAPAELPVRFKLYIPSRPETKHVLLRWRSALEFGCEYSTGVADEKAVYDLMARVVTIEDLIRIGAAVTPPTEALADPGPAPIDLDPELLQRIAEIEMRLAAPSAPAIEPDILERVARLEQDNKARAALADLGPTPVDLDPALLQRIAEIETRLAAPPAIAPDIVERVARLEQDFIARGATAHPGVVASGPDALLVKRIADMEAKLMSLRVGVAPTPLALDLSPLEKRIDAVAISVAELIVRAERFLNARIDDVEAGMIAAPPPPPQRSADIVGMERRLLEMEQALREPVAIEGLDAIEERMSNLEMSLLELRADVHDAPKPDADEEQMRERIAVLERRNEDVTDALRSVLEMLTARNEMRATG